MLCSRDLCIRFFSNRLSRTEAPLYLEEKMGGGRVSVHSPPRMSGSTVFQMSGVPDPTPLVDIPVRGEDIVV